MLHRAVKMWFWVTYDHLGKLLLLNAALMLPCALLTGLALMLPPLPAILLLVLLYAAAVPGCLAALGHTARTLIETHEADLQTITSGFRQYFLPGALVGLLLNAAIAASLAGAWYYLLVLARPTPSYAYALAALCLWCGAFAATIQFHALPALAQQRAGIRAALHTGLLLSADNPLTTAALLLNFLGLTALATLPPAYVCFSLAPMATLQAAAYEILARYYAAPIVDGRRAPDYRDAEDDYLNRGFRDFLFPWKM